MKLYDFGAAIKYIQMHADVIDQALLGIDGAWFWTAEPIYEKGNFTIPIEDIPDLTIGGIKGSHWGIPMLKIEFKDESVQFKKCFVEWESNIQKPEWFELGKVSQTCKIMHNKIRHLT